MDHRNTPRTFVADLAINPQTGHAEVINNWPILAQEVDNSQVRENMKQLLDIILGFFEDEMKKVEAGTLKEEDQLLALMYKKTTQIPNIILDQYLRTLNAAELKILLVILRQTNGWIDKRTGNRKIRDRISYSQFMDKTGYSRRILTTTIQSLETKGLITVSNRGGQTLETSKSRRGSWLYFNFRHVHFSASTSALLGREHVHSSAHNKTNYTKLKETKLRVGRIQSIGEVIVNMAT